MRHFSVKVNGVVYEVEVEEVGGSVQSDRPEASTPAAKPADAPKPSAQGASPSDGTPVKAPMPGTLSKISVTVGQKVARGDLLCILEAMKMENEIFSPCDGTVLSIDAAQGASLSTDTLIMTVG